MSDVADTFNAVRDERRRLREKFGKECPRCKDVRPKAHASILLPGQTCRVDGYRDPRPRIPDSERQIVRVKP